MKCLETLPKNVLCKILLSLKLKDLKELCLTNKNFKELICNNDEFWQQKLYHDYPNTIGVFNNTYRGQFKKLYYRTANSLFRLAGFEEISKRSNIDWKKLDSISFLIECNKLENHFRIDISTIYFDEHGEIDENDTFSLYLNDYYNNVIMRLEEKIFNMYGNKETCPKEIPAYEILKYFEPLLLKKLEDLNIPFVDFIPQPNQFPDKRQIIDFNYSIPVFIKFFIFTKRKLKR